MGEQPKDSIRRHSIAVRVTHWINALCLLILLMSGLQIFNAHPALYWGQAVDFHPELTRVFHRELTHLQIMFRGSGLGQCMAGLLHFPGCLA